MQTVVHPHNQIFIGKSIDLTVVQIHRLLVTTLECVFMYESISYKMYKPLGLAKIHYTFTAHLYQLLDQIRVLEF